MEKPMNVSFFKPFTKTKKINTALSSTTIKKMWTKPIQDCYAKVFEFIQRRIYILINRLNLNLEKNTNL